jgi:hypothetical protein
MKLKAIVIAAAAALAAPAFADTVTTTYYYDTPSGAYVKQQTIVADGNPYNMTYLPATYVGGPNATTSTVTYTYVEPATVAYVEPPIIVTAPMTEDQAITNEVIDRIASDPTIHGRVGVDTYMDKVTLSGRVGTPWQAEKAQTHAQNVEGVREVDNQLRSRIGG